VTTFGVVWRGTVISLPSSLTSVLAEAITVHDARTNRTSTGTAAAQIRIQKSPQVKKKAGRLVLDVSTSRSTKSPLLFRSRNCRSSNAPADRQRFHLSTTRWPCVSITYEDFIRQRSTRVAIVICYPLPSTRQLAAFRGTAPRKSEKVGVILAARSALYQRLLVDFPHSKQ